MKQKIYINYFARDNRKKLKMRDGEYQKVRKLVMQKSVRVN